MSPPIENVPGAPTRRGLPRGWMRRWAVAAAAGLALGIAPLVAEDPGEEARPVKVRIEGLGWWGGRELRQALRILEPEDGLKAPVGAVFIEDATLLLQAEVVRDGFLHPSGSVEVWREGRKEGSFPWTEKDLPRIPRDIAADALVFRIEPGVRYTFERLEFRGLAEDEAEAAGSFFVSSGLLLEGAAARLFTPARLERGLESLREQLSRQGFMDAHVSVAGQARDDRTGEVRVVIAVEKGPRHFIAEVELPEDLPAATAAPIEARVRAAEGAVFSPLRRQDLEQDVRSVLFEQGYAEARVDLHLEDMKEAADRIERRFRLEVEPGPQVRVGGISFVGAGRTKERVLLRATGTRAGDLFDRGRIERDRLQLSRLGIFGSVRVETEPVSPDLWNLRYLLRPAKRTEFSVHAGYGSYEQVRGGFDLFQSNIFGRGHRARLQLIGSMKSASADYNYTIPQIFGTRADGSVRVFGLTREEVSFEREEYGISAGLRHRLERLGLDAALRYQFESLNADPDDATVGSEVPTDSRVAALTLDLSRDRRDNPVNPRRGYLVSATLETAARAIGGGVDYERLELRASWHQRLAEQTTAHVGFRTGVLWPLGRSSEEPPLNKRFFPGGENTIRGFREGRAAPRDPEGQVIGAEVSSILNLELEQGLARNFSGVLFVDAGLTSARLDDFPGDQFRVSLGLGLRYHTLIGPVRLEYGHNVVRETGDARGAVHFSLGFPF